MGSKNQKKRNENSYITELSQERQIQLSKHGQVSLPYTQVVNTMANQFLINQDMLERIASNKGMALRDKLKTWH